MNESRHFGPEIARVTAYRLFRLMVPPRSKYAVRRLLLPARLSGKARLGVAKHPFVTDSAGRGARSSRVHEKYVVLKRKTR